MPGSLHDLAALENRRWRDGRQRLSARATSQWAARRTDAPTATDDDGSGWVAYTPLTGRRGADWVDPMADFDFVEATAVPSAVVVSFRWRPDADQRTYLLMVPFGEDPVDLDGGAVTILEHITFRVLHDPGWTERTIPLAPDLSLVAPRPPVDWPGEQR